MHAWGALASTCIYHPSPILLGAVQPRYSVALLLDNATTDAQAPPLLDSRFVSRQLAETDERVIFVSAISTEPSESHLWDCAILPSTFGALHHC